MKTEKKKSKESLIGKIIYGFLLFMPLLSVLVTCLYVIQNDNAHESYYGETINESSEINQENKEIKTDVNYHLYANKNSTNNINNVILNLTITKINYVMNDNQTNTLSSNFENVTNLYFFVTNEMQYIQFRTNTNSIIGSNVNVNTSLIDFDYEYNSSSQSENLYTFLQNNSYTTEYNKYSYLDDAFMYGLQKTEESQYFNWAKNTALYTGVNEFTNALGITTTYIPFLMTYWLLISVVYLIYDIALMMLHMAHNKIHQLEGSI